MNKVILMGRLTKEPELKQTPQGVSVCRFSLAVNRRFAKEGQQNADFINCTAWRTTADFISKYFNKGSMISVVGSLQSRSWEDANGKKQYAMDVVVDEAYFAASKGNNAQNGNTASIDEMGFQEVDASDDLPF